MHKVVFRCIEEDEEWQVEVDGVVLIPELREKWMCLEDSAMNPLWEALGVTLEWVYPDDAPPCTATTCRRI